MTFEAQLVPGDRRYRVRSAEEHEQAFSRAAQHSRIVAILRKTLPVMAVVVLASYFISTRLSVTVGGVTASVSGVEVNDGNLRMVNPTLKGMDKKNGAYVVSADYADQDMKNPKMIKLHAIKAELTTDQKGWSRMQAVRGLFNSEFGTPDNAGRHSRVDQLRGHRQAHPCQPRNEEPGVALAPAGGFRPAERHRACARAQAELRRQNAAVSRQGACAHHQGAEQSGRGGCK